MSAELTEDEEAGDGAGADRSVTVAVDGRDVSVDLPADAGPEEAAAIVSAVGAHLTDQARAAAAAASEGAESDRADPWKLAGRMQAVGRRHYPTDVQRGEEWQAAARSFY